MKYKKYDKNDDFSYTFGLFPTIELVKSGKAKVLALIFHESIKHSPEFAFLQDYARQNKVEVIVSTKQVEALASKDNCYAVGVFKKYAETLNLGNHVVLVSPQDSGNLGTIIRTMLGMNLTNLAIIENGKNTTNVAELEKTKTSIDVFNPKVIRASMGSIFNINLETFKTFDDYAKKYPQNDYYAFCLGVSTTLSQIEHGKNRPFSLVFGNEATGLSSDVITKCKAVKIEQSNKIDSFNLAISVGIAMYEFSQTK